jgi:hypothetical protein
MQAGNLLKKAIGGGGAPGEAQIQGAASPAPLTTESPEAQKKSRADYENEQQAYWQQLLAGTGNVQEGGGLPPNIQDMIRRQSSLYPA